MSFTQPMVVVLCTVPDSLDQAELLASKMVQRRLAACVNLIPQVRSLFRWDGAVARETEILMMIKTTEEMV
ncbi:MAG: divalent-cation tolerance protein CutA, partial [Myxococcota bacterium]